MSRYIANVIAMAAPAGTQKINQTDYSASPFVPCRLVSSCHHFMSVLSGSLESYPRKLADLINLYATHTRHPVHNPAVMITPNIVQKYVFMC